MSVLTQPTQTATIYGYIKNQQYNDAIKVLSDARIQYTNNRAVLSLLGYCYYQLQNYDSAYNVYTELTTLYPMIAEYCIYMIQCALKLCMYDIVKQYCNKQLQSNTDPQNTDKYTQLLLQCTIEQNDMTQAKKQLQTITEQNTTKYNIDNNYILVAHACIAYKQQQYTQAEKLYITVLQNLGYNPTVAYNLAVTYYKQKQYSAAMHELTQLIDYTVHKYPDLPIGIVTADTDITTLKSTGNTLQLKYTMLIETFNLKAAIEYCNSNTVAAKQSLLDMPYRVESELDPVTLHNTALTHMDAEPSKGFEKFHFLLSNPPFPEHTLHNLLILYIKYNMYDLAADTLAENIHLHSTALTTELYEYLEAIVCVSTNPAESYYKLGQLGDKYIARLKAITKQINDAKQLSDTTVLQQLLQQYDTVLELYIPCLMSQCKIYWELGNYQQVETIFQNSAEYCSEHSIWKLNVGHVFFMSGAIGDTNKFSDAIRYYEPIVQKAQQTQLPDIYDGTSGLLSLTAIVLANLCVSYIMTNANEQAEELMRCIETDEECTVQYQQAQGLKVEPQYHLCIVNLVIGTLYCSKGNYEFGISRIMKSLEPFNKKLGIDTWYYAKRCLLSLIELCSKHMMIMSDTFYDEIIEFLTQCEVHGKTVITLLETPEQHVDPDIHNVAYEARLIKRLMYMLHD